MASVHSREFRGSELTLPLPLLIFVLGLSVAALTFTHPIEMVLILASLVAGIALSGSV